MKGTMKKIIIIIVTKNKMYKSDISSNSKTLLK